MRSFVVDSAWPLGYLASSRSSLRGFEFPDLPSPLEAWRDRKSVWGSQIGASHIQLINPMGSSASPLGSLLESQTDTPKPELISPHPQTHSCGIL